MLEKDAVVLFRLIARDRNRTDLLQFRDERVLQLVKKVRCYPLLIKWSIGQVCLGKAVDIAFSAIFEGTSEIAQFSFNDVFSLFSTEEKIVLYSMVILGDRPVLRDALMQLSNLDEDKFEEAIRRLITSSFIFTTNKHSGAGMTMEFLMLELTRGFVQAKLDEDTKTKAVLLARYHQVLQNLNELERAASGHLQEEFLLGIRTREEKIAFHYVKTAKLREKVEDWEEAEKNYQQAIRAAPKLAYAYTEYSKFQLARGHPTKALDLARQAVEVDPDNFHAWFYYGASLRRWHKAKDALECFKRAKALNSSWLPTYNELGRTYTVLGEYDKAEAEFLSAQKEEKYPNYRHRIICLFFRADNLRYWARTYGARNDTEGQIAKLMLAYEVISQAIATPLSQQKAWRLYREICLSLGIVLWKVKGETEGKRFLERSIENLVMSGNRSNLPEDSIVARANYHLASLSLRRGSANSEQILAFIKRGLTACPPGSVWFEKLSSLQRKVGQRQRHT